MSIRLVDGEQRTTRGTSNRNARGSSYTRRKRRAWLIDRYRADVDVVRVTFSDETQAIYYPTDKALGVAWDDLDDFVEIERLPACRCYRCGVLLTDDTVTVDRIIPGCKGGTYQRNNIRPACGGCNSETGGALTGQGRRS